MFIQSLGEYDKDVRFGMNMNVAHRMLQLLHKQLQRRSQTEVMAYILDELAKNNSNILPSISFQLQILTNKMLPSYYHMDSYLYSY